MMKDEISFDKRLVQARLSVLFIFPNIQLDECQEAFSTARTSRLLPKTRQPYILVVSGSVSKLRSDYIQYTKSVVSTITLH